MTVRTARCWLLAAVALVLVTTVLPAGPAVAAGTYAVALSTPTPVVPYGDDAQFSAVVTAGGAPAPSTYVTLFRTGPDGVREPVDYGATGADGAVSLTDYQPASGGSYVATAGVDDSSAPVQVSVAFAVRAPAQTSFFPPTVVSPVAVPPGGRIAVRGTIAPAGSTTPLQVERRFGAGPWESLGTVAVNGDGSFSRPLGRLREVGTWTVRLTHPAESGLVAGTAVAATTVTVTGAGRAKAWRPVAGTKRHPARWDTCRIGYRVNERRMPAAGRADLREAMRRVTRVTGIRFRYLGRTAATPRAGYPGPGHDRIVVAWAPPEKSGGLLVDGVGGVGGTSRTASRLLSGYVLMNSDYAATAEPGFGAGQPHGLVLMHELGHVVGLDHSSDQRQIMASGAPLPAAVWGAADLTGLRTLGARCR